MNVQRNFEAPRFEESRYGVAIAESSNIGTSVAQVVATDGDRQVNVYCSCG